MDQSKLIKQEDSSVVLHDDLMEIVKEEVPMKDRLNMSIDLIRDPNGSRGKLPHLTTPACGS